MKEAAQRASVGPLMPALLLAAVVLLALVVRVQLEQSALLRAAQQAESDVDRALLLCEAARWSLPWTASTTEALEAAMAVARVQRSTDPQVARRIAEEVRAALFVVQAVGSPQGAIFDEANELIIGGLAVRDGLDQAAIEALRQTYETWDGPQPVAYVVSSVGFVFWLLGLWFGLWKRGRVGFAGFALSGLGLLLFLAGLSAA